MGFAAHAGPGLGGLTIYPVLAERAGIGAFGRHGLKNPAGNVESASKMSCRSNP